MNKIIYLSISILMLLGFVSCDTDNEVKTTYEPIEYPESYFQNLRAYKKSNHQISFGWFGGWNGNSPSLATRLSSAPDSMDIIAIWGGYLNLDDKKKADLKYVQEVLGTKVVYTTFAHEIPAPFEDTEESIKAYAKALVDTMVKYNYDGVDFDYEPGFGGVGPLVGPISRYPNYRASMETLVRAMGEFIGPKSGTGKLFIIDGVPYDLNVGLSEFFDYGVVQSYDSSGDLDLQTRLNRALAKGWDPKQYVFTEDFEKWAETGGVSSYKGYDDHGEAYTVNSLKGMALFKPTINGERVLKGGCGSYHMENEYSYSPSYKYMREAIQLMNPAKPN